MWTALLRLCVVPGSNIPNVSYPDHVFDGFSQPLHASAVIVTQIRLLLPPFTPFSIPHPLNVL
jgi:hypothetical protein